MKNDALRQLYIDELKDLYHAETQLVKVLPKMAKASSSVELAAGFEEHLNQTKGHLERLEQIFEMLEESPKGRKCLGMEGLVREGAQIMGEDYNDEVLDAALIGAARRVEHYEIAGYGTVRMYADLLGEQDQAALLAETLNEEKQTDAKFTELAQDINLEAAKAGQAEKGEPGKIQTKEKRKPSRAA
jgi:ferritin-like metal-binding protein YciE